MSSKSKKLRFISLIWDYASALSLIALLVLLWHLGKGPIKVNFLRPYIIQALTNDTSSYDLSVGSVNLELIHSVQPVRVIAKNVTFEAKDGKYIAEAPRLSLSFSARALLKGMLAPSTIDIEEPLIHIKAAYGIGSTEEAKSKDNMKELNLKKLQFYFEQYEDFLERFNSYEKLYLESFINNIGITGATLVMEEVETGQSFTFKDMNFSFERGITDIILTADSAVQFENRTAGMDMSLKYRLLNGEVRFGFGFSDLVVTDLYDVMFMEKGDIRAVDIPVSGKLTALIDFGNVLKDKEHFADNLGKNIKDVGFKLEGGRGTIGFGNSKEFDYRVSSFNLEGNLHGELDKVRIEKAAFDFDGKNAELSLSAEGFKDYFFKSNLENFKINFTANIGAFDMDELSRLWPRYLGEDAWQWCKESLYGGTMESGIFKFDFGWNPKTQKFGLLKIDGKASVADANLSYLEGMPVIKNVYGLVTFAEDKIGIKVDKGVSDGVILTGGNVLLYDLNKEDNFIAIDLTGNSTITDALKLIDHDPLNFTKAIGIDPELVAGDVDIGLKLDFELKNDLKPEDIKVQVIGNMKQVEYLGLEDGKTFVADTLNLKVTEKGYELSGTAKYQNIPLDLTINEKFNEKKYKSRITANIKINDTILKTLGVESEMLAAPYFTGESEMETVITFLNNGDIELAVNGSLKDTEIDYAFLGFSKKKGIPCRAKITMIIADDKIKEVPEFSLMKAQFSAIGSIQTDEKGRLKTVDIREIKAPKAFAKAKIDAAYTPDLSLKVTVTGDSYDLTEFFDTQKKDTGEKKKKEKSLKDPLEDVIDTDIVVGVNKLWTNDHVPITNFAGKAELRHGIGLHRMNLVGNYGASRDVKMKLDFEPRGEEYMLTVDSNNAGSTLKVLRLYKNMKGGNLKIEAKRDKYKNFRGHARMWDFALQDTPVFAKVLSVASLTGIVDMLSGEGLTFSHLNAPFTYTFSTKNLATENARMTGSVMGLTMNGRYNLVDEDIEAKGMVIPAYGLNSFLGNIPLVGKILAGKDGTIFATNYEINGSIDKPEISINALSTLAPNSLKELFSDEEY